MLSTQSGPGEKSARPGERAAGGRGGAPGRCGWCLGASRRRVDRRASGTSTGHSIVLGRQNTPRAGFEPARCYRNARCAASTIEAALPHRPPCSRCRRARPATGGGTLRGVALLSHSTIELPGLSGPIGIRTRFTASLHRGAAPCRLRVGLAWRLGRRPTPGHPTTRFIPPCTTVWPTVPTGGFEPPTRGRFLPPCRRRITGFYPCRWIRRVAYSEPRCEPAVGSRIVTEARRPIALRLWPPGRPCRLRGGIVVPRSVHRPGTTHLPTVWSTEEEYFNRAHARGGE